MKALSVNIETFSEAPIARTGAWRYAHDPSFEILLFAYAVDGGEVVVDLARGEHLPDEVGRPTVLAHTMELRLIARDRPPCWICGEPIDYMLPHLDLRAYVVDHVSTHRSSTGRRKSSFRDRRVRLTVGGRPLLGPPSPMPA